MKFFFNMNFFLLILLLFFSACQQKPKCFDEDIYIDKIYDKQSFKKDYEKIVKNGFTIENKVEYSVYMNSIFKNKIDENTLNNIINKYMIEDNSEYKIKYIVVENDKLDPNKKSQSCKLFAGYISFEVYHKELLIYKVYTEFMDIKDIEVKTNCIFEMMKYKANK